MALEVGETGEREEESGAESEGTTLMVRITVLYTIESPALTEIADPSQQFYYICRSLNPCMQLVPKWLRTVVMSVNSEINGNKGKEEARRERRTRIVRT